MSVNCRDPQCPWGSIEHYQHEPDGPIYALMGGPAVLLRDTPEDRERLALAVQLVGGLGLLRHGTNDKIVDAIIAALRGER